MDGLDNRPPKKEKQKNWKKNRRRTFIGLVIIIISVIFLYLSEFNYAKWGWNQ